MTRKDALVGFGDREWVSTRRHGLVCGHKEEAPRRKTVVCHLCCLLAVRNRSPKRLTPEKVRERLRACQQGSEGWHCLFPANAHGPEAATKHEGPPGYRIVIAEQAEIRKIDLNTSTCGYDGGIWIPTRRIRIFQGFSSAGFRLESVLGDGCSPTSDTCVFAF